MHTKAGVTEKPSAPICRAGAHAKIAPSPTPRGVARERRDDGRRGGGEGRVCTLCRVLWILVVLAAAHAPVLKLVVSLPRDEHGWARGQGAAPWWPRPIDTLRAQPPDCARAGRLPGRHQQHHAVHAVSRSLRHRRPGRNPREPTTPMVRALAASHARSKSPTRNPVGLRTLLSHAQTDAAHRIRISPPDHHISNPAPHLPLACVSPRPDRGGRRGFARSREGRRGDADDGNGRSGAPYSSPRHPPHAPPVPHGARRSPRPNPVPPRSAVRLWGSSIVRYRACWLVCSNDRSRHGARLPPSAAALPTINPGGIWPACCHTRRGLAGIRHRRW